MTKLTGRVVLVTGSTRGIGAACAEALTSAGAMVITHGRRPDRLDRRVAALGTKTIGMDLTQDDAARELAEAALEIHGRVDAVVHCAGIGWYGPAVDTPDPRIDELLRINLRAPIQLCAALVPPMVERGSGHVAFVGSIAGLTGVANEAVYAASKAAVLAYAESLRRELAGTPVGVSTVSPAAVRTDFYTARGVPYGRRFPRPMHADRVARAVVDGMTGTGTDRIVPRWVRIAPVIRATVPPAFRALSDRFG